MLEGIRRIFSREKNPADELASMAEHLNLAYAKLRMANRFRSDPRVRRSMLYSAMLVNMPLMTPDAMSSVYFKSCLAELARVRRDAARLLSRGDLPEGARIALSRLVDTLSVGRDVTVSELYEKIMESKTLLEEAAAHLSGL